MKLIQQYLQGLNDCLDEFLQQDVNGVADTIYQAYCNGRRIYVLGNGGSATTASHFARDLQIGTAAGDKPRIRATSLGDNIATITSLANDIDYESIFKEQMVGQLDKGDVIIGISASGNSPNVLAAIEYGLTQEAHTVGFIGFKGGKLKDLVAQSIVLTSDDYGQVEDAHACLCHLVVYLLRNKLAES